MSRIVKSVVAAATALCAATVMAPAANAAGQHWGTLYAVDHGVKVAAAYGDFANNGGVYATVGANWADMRVDANAVYVEVQFYFWKKNANGDMAWVPDPIIVQSTRSSRLKYVGAPLSKRLDRDSSQVRAAIKVCEDINNHADPCSSEAFLSFSY